MFTEMISKYQSFINTLYRKPDVGFWASFSSVLGHIQCEQTIHSSKVKLIFGVMHAQNIRVLIITVSDDFFSLLLTPVNMKERS